MAIPSHMEEKDYDFVDAVPARLTCSVCTKALREPHLTECCGQHFCQACLTSWLQTHRNKTCPHCRARKFVHILDKPVQRDVARLKVRCSHHEEGCQWVGELGDLQTHLDSEEGCDFVEVSCPNGCLMHNADSDDDEEDEFGRTSGGVSLFTTTLVQRGKVNAHLKNECLLRMHECEHCGTEDTYSRITGQDPYNKYTTGVLCHYDVCPEYPLTCPNECGAKDIKQKDMPAHQEQCPLELVECPNKCTDSGHMICPNYDSDGDTFAQPAEQEPVGHLDEGTYSDHMIRPNYDSDDDMPAQSEPAPEKSACPVDSDHTISYYDIAVDTFEEVGPTPEPVGLATKCSGSDHMIHPNYDSDDDWESFECPTTAPKSDYTPPRQYEGKCELLTSTFTCITTYTMVYRKDLEEHLKSKCSQRSYSCEHCGEDDTYRNIMEEHYRQCPMLPQTCPNKCGASEIKRRDMPAHRLQCPLEPVQCPFEQAGCEARLVRRDLEEHVTSQTQQHLLLTLRKTCSLEQECAHLRQTCRTLQTRNRVLEQTCRTLQTKNRDLEERCKKLEDKSSKLEKPCRMLEERPTSYSRFRKW